MIKKIIKMIFISAIIIAVSAGFAGLAAGAVYTKTIDAAPYIENGRTFDTTRPIAEAFGIHVDWERESRQVTLSRGTREVVMRVGSFEMSVTGPEGSRTITMDVAPELKGGRVFLPSRYWAERFGLKVNWLEETGEVAVSEGEKVLTVKPGSSAISLTGGYFLKLYTGDPSFRFFYPETGVLGSTWEGYAEVLMDIDGDLFTIAAINSGADRFDPTRYTEQTIAEHIARNTEENDTTARELPFGLYGRPSYLVSGTIKGVPQAGVVFLSNGFICGVSVEYKWNPPADAGGAGAGGVVSAGGAGAGSAGDAGAGSVGSAGPGGQGKATQNGNESGRESALVLDESEMSHEAQAGEAVIDKAHLQKYLKVINALLNEIMPSFSVND